MSTYNRPGRGVHVTNTATSAAINHGQVAQEEGHVGVAVKQVPATWDAALSAHSVIADDEEYFLITKGVVQVDTVGGFARGEPIYIVAATNALTETGSGNVPFGRVVEIAGERGVPTGQVRIDLDAKDNIDAVA